MTFVFQTDIQNEIFTKQIIVEGNYLNVKDICYICMIE